MGLIGKIIKWGNEPLEQKFFQAIRDMDGQVKDCASRWHATYLNLNNSHEHNMLLLNEIKQELSDAESKILFIYIEDPNFKTIIKKVEEAKEKIMEREEIWHELREKNINISYEKLTRLRMLETECAKYGGDRSAYMQYIEDKLTEMKVEKKVEDENKRVQSLKHNIEVQEKLLEVTNKDVVRKSTQQLSR